MTAERILPPRPLTLPPLFFRFLQRRTTGPRFSTAHLRRPNFTLEAAMAASDSDGDWRGYVVTPEIVAGLWEEGVLVDLVTCTLLVCELVFLTLIL